MICGGTRLIAALLAGLMAGCVGSADLPEKAVRALYGGVGNTGPGREEAELSRLLADAATPKTVLRLPDRGVALSLLLAGERAGVKRWRSTDNVQIYTRDGLIIGTRGLGNDLLTVDSGDSAAVIATGSGGQIVRIHRILTADDQIDLQSWVCDIIPKDTERLRVAEDAWTEARVVTETCHGPRGRFENRHWVEDGVLRQTRQYAGPELGMIELLFLP